MVATSLSHYQIVDELGRGGMGIVYKARDTKLDRTVAVKVLPSAALSSDDDRARFYREAKAAAQLHHPNIASVFEIDEAVPDGSGSDDLRPFIAMEFIDGQSLEERVKEGPLKLEEAVQYALQIADALEAAHEKSIVHRDIKSANVMLTSKGVAKVLDFGLAKTVHSTMLTRMGSTVGTFAYMSPEQTRGENVDHRTDLWALGVVLYELVSGRLPFKGDYEQAVTYSILNEDPEPLTAIRTGVPMGLEWIVSKLLAKNPDDRYQSAKDLLVDLRTIDLKASGMSRTTMSAASTPAASASGQVPRTTKESGSWKLPAAALGGLLLGAVLFGLLWPRGDAPPVRPAQLVSVTLPANIPLDPVGGAQLGVGRRALVLSHDGTHLAYLTRSNGVSKIAVREMSSGTTRIITGSENASFPFFSPDDSWLGYFEGNRVRKVLLAGGNPVDLGESFGSPTSAVWLDNGRILFSDLDRRILGSIDSEGGTASVLVDGPLGHRVHLGVLPGGRVSGSQGPRMYTFDPADPYNVNDLGIEGWGARYVNSGHLLFSLRGRLMAAPFDAENLSVSGSIIPFVDSVRTEVVSHSPQYTISETGTLVYVPGLPADLAHVVKVSTTGRAEVLNFSPEIFGELDVSPDGRKLVIRVQESGGSSTWIYDLDAGARSLFARDTERIGSSVWTRDSNAIVYVDEVDSPNGNRSRIRVRRLGETESRTLFESSEFIRVSSTSRDGSLVAGYNDTQVFALVLKDGLVADTLFYTSKENKNWGPSFSPDGRYIAYTNLDEGRSIIHVESTTPGGRVWQVSPDGGEEPKWSPDGDKLYYSQGQSWYEVPVQTEGVFSFGRSRKIFSGRYLNVPGFGYDVFPDDSGFLVIRGIEQDSLVSELNAIVNFDQMLLEKAPARE